MINTKLAELPKRWYIIWRNKENFEIIQDYFKSNWIYESDNLHSNAGQTFDNKYISKNNTKLIFLKEYTEISFDQFKKWVIKEKPLKTDTEYTFIIKFLKKLNIQ